MVKLSFSKNLNRIPCFSAFLSAKGHWGPVTIMLCLLLATEASCLLMLLGGYCFFLSLKTQSERKKNKEDMREEERREGERAELIAACSGLAGKHNEVKSLLGWCAFLHFFFPGFEVGRERWEKRKEEVKDWQVLSRSSTKPSGLGRGKEFGDLGTFLGHSLAANPFLPRSDAARSTF